MLRKTHKDPSLRFGMTQLVSLSFERSEKFLGSSGWQVLRFLDSL